MSKTLLNSRYKFDVSENQKAFQARNRVNPTWSGPVFVVEDVWVPCNRCNAPIDPVSRIPVGHMYFHPHCLRCVVCDRKSKAQIFKAVQDQPVCQDCYHLGYNIPKDRTATNSLPRGISPSSTQARKVQGMTPQSKQSLLMGGTVSSSGASPSSFGGTAMSLPSLMGSPAGSTDRARRLLEQQQITQMHDPNLLVMAPSVPAPPSRGGKRGTGLASRESSRPGRGSKMDKARSKGGAPTASKTTTGTSILKEQPHYLSTQAL